MALNPNLVTEVRTDKNGKRTTRHVRAGVQQGSGSLKMPAPVLAPAKSLEPIQGRVKVRLRQMEAEYFAIKSRFTPADDELMTEQERQETEDGLTTYSFKANALEFYSVCSAVQNVGSALKMLSEGVRSFEAAQQYLIEHDAIHLFTPRDELMREAVEKNLPPQKFIEYEHLTTNRDHKVDLMLFASHFMTGGLNGTVDTQIINGSISYDHIKELGITKLRSADRLYSLAPLLVKVQSGTEELASVKKLLDKAVEEKVSSIPFGRIVWVADRAGIDAVTSLSNLGFVAEAQQTHTSGKAAVEYGDTLIERIMFSASLRDQTDEEYRHRIGSGTYLPFWEAGIPLETAVKALNRGLGFEEALAIHQEGISEAIAEGWL